MVVCSLCVLFDSISKWLIMELISANILGGNDLIRPKITPVKCPFNRIIYGGGFKSKTHGRGSHPTVF